MKLKKLIESGVILVPISFVAIALGYRELNPEAVWNAKTWMAITGCSFIPWLLSWINKTSNPEYQNRVYDGREQALHPKAPKDMLYAKPNGFVFGKEGKMYVCKRVDEPGSILVHGGSGSYKSSTIIQNFLIDPDNKRNCNSIVLDLKHELVDKCVFPNEVYGPDNPAGNIIILDPMDRKHGFGWDPLYGLSDESSDTEIHERMEVIAQCIIPIPKGDNAVWSLSSQQYLRGSMTYFYEYEGLRTLPDIIRTIKSANIKEITEMIVTTALPGSTAYTDIISFHDMADETITSVDMNLSQKIVQFITNPDLEWCLGTNPRKCSPPDMLERSIYLCLPEDKLQQWGQLVFLVFNQFLSWMMGLPEHEADSNRKRFSLILDETVALLAGVGAPMPLLSQCLRIGARGKGCTILICCQSISGLYEVMGKDQTKDMVSNMSYKYILDSSDSDTSKEIIGWCGKYMRRKLSASGGGSTQKNTISYENDDLIREQDLMSLPQSGEVIVVSNRAGYLRLKKCLVFKDPYYKDLLDKVKQSKQQAKEEKKDECSRTEDSRRDPESSAGVINTGRDECQVDGSNEE
ncbi:MAG: type IV secretory system conjugative DNA transfer family protein [Lachnospiraceae bacterium]|nr:type IV secretory system conjugative DNA transfer family protein [Lachnospiraceae bacterium]